MKVKNVKLKFNDLFVGRNVWLVNRIGEVYSGIVTSKSVAPQYFTTTMPHSVARKIKTSTGAITVYRDFKGSCVTVFKKHKHAVEAAARIKYATQKTKPRIRAGYLARGILTDVLRADDARDYTLDFIGKEDLIGKVKFKSKTPSKAEQEAKRHFEDKGRGLVNPFFHASLLADGLLVGEADKENKDVD